jgi:hypothetical protein
MEPHKAKRETLHAPVKIYESVEKKAEINYAIFRRIKKEGRGRSPGLHGKN